LARKLKSLRDHGASISDLARHHRPRSYQLPDFEYAGHNARMTDFQGALGAAQMLRLPEIMQRRIQLAERYNAGLAGLSWLRTPHVPPDCVHAYQAYVTLFAPHAPSMANLEHMNGQRNTLMDHLEAAGIATRPGTHAVHMLGYYRDRYGLRPRDCPNAALADGLSMAIPLYPQMTDAEQDYVIESIRGWKPEPRAESALTETVVPSTGGARASTI
jgi:dTDP-4-amino-4,6-dideoxygalactose transaminase